MLSPDSDLFFAVLAPYPGGLAPGVSTGDDHFPLVQKFVNWNKVALAVLTPEISATH